jgi:hypothetical protein
MVSKTVDVGSIPTPRAKQITHLGEIEIHSRFRGTLVRVYYSDVFSNRDTFISIERPFADRAKCLLCRAPYLIHGPERECPQYKVKFFCFS